MVLAFPPESAAESARSVCSAPSARGLCIILPCLHSSFPVPLPVPLCLPLYPLYLPSLPPLYPSNLTSFRLSFLSVSPSLAPSSVSLARQTLLDVSSTGCAFNTTNSARNGCRGAATLCFSSLRTIAVDRVTRDYAVHTGGGMLMPCDSSCLLEL